MSNRLTRAEWDAVLTALSFLLSGDTDDFEPDLVDAAERALAKLSARPDPRPTSAPAAS